MKTKNKQNEIAEKAVAHAKTIKEVAEQNMRDKLYEAFSPQLKKMISQSILELDEEDDMDNYDDMEDMDEMGDYEDEDYMEEEEGEGSDAEADELDPEDLEDLEKALDEEGEDYDDDGHEEVPTDVADALPDEEEEDLEEASDDYDDMEEESPEDFMAELQALIDEVDAEELNESESVDESEDGGSYTEKDKGDGEQVKKYESEDGGSYSEKDKGDGEHTKKYEGEDEDDDVDALKEENQKLKATISEINKQLQETVLDEYKTNKFTKLVKEHRITETAKLKLMRAIDSGESEREVNRIAEVFERSLPKKKRKSKRSLKESKGGRNSSVRKPLSKKKNLKENKQAGKSGYDFDRWAELADIS